MELRQLKYFLAVADNRSFVSAAEKLYISRQAISKSVAQLEQELNVELFMRDSGGAFLTPAGVMFYERVRTLVMELDSVRSQMQAYGTRYRQRIRIAFSVGTVPLLEQQLLEYRENQSNVEVFYEECSEEDCRRRLMEHKVDMVITTDPVYDPLIITREWIHSPFGILIKNQKELKDVEIKDLTWIPLAGQKDRQTGDFCERNGISLRFQGFDMRRLLELTAAGKCAMVMPECLAPNWMPQISWLPIEGGGEWMLYVSYPRSVEKNLMFSAAMDDMYRQVFIPMQTDKEKLL